MGRRKEMEPVSESAREFERGWRDCERAIRCNSSRLPRLDQLAGLEARAMKFGLTAVWREAVDRAKGEAANG